MNEKYINIDDIISSLKIDKKTLRQWVKENKFPAPLKVNDRVTLWSYAVIENWIAQQHKANEFIDNQDLEL